MSVTIFIFYKKMFDKKTQDRVEHDIIVLPLKSVVFLYIPDS